MKNSYNTIEQNLKAGLNVVVKDLKRNEYCTMSPFKDEGGNYRMSSWCNSIEESKQWIGCYCGEPKEYWENKDLEIVEVFRPEYEPFKIGQKVRILDSIKNIEDWESIEDKFEDMTGVIRAVFLDRIGTYYSINGWCVGHEYLIPLIKEDDEVEKAIKLLEERGRLKDGKILS